MKLNKILGILTSAVVSVSMFGMFSVSAEETEEKLYTLKEMLDMSDEEYFETFPDAESGLEAKKNYYEIEKEKIIENAEDEYQRMGSSELTLEEWIEYKLSVKYKLDYKWHFNLLDSRYEESEMKYIPNETEKKLDELLKDSSFEYYVYSPIAFDVNDGRLIYDFLFSASIKVESEKIEINDENLLFQDKVRNCLSQVMPYMSQYSAPISNAGEQKEIITGDVNLDETVDLYDVIWIAKHLINIFTLSEGQQMIGDVNGDGLCDLYDAIEISKQIMKTSEAE